jgi:hypothetical protein
LRALTSKADAIVSKSQILAASEKDMLSMKSQDLVRHHRYKQMEKYKKEADAKVLIPA